MSRLIPFEFEGRPVRVVTDEQGEPWFVAKDIAENLSYADAAAAVQKHCKRSKPLNQLNSDNSSELSPKLLMITEADLYRLVVKSAKPEAEKFEEWVMEDVLPSIRKTGSYSAKNSALLPQDYIAANEVFTSNLALQSLFSTATRLFCPPTGQP